MNDFEYVDCHIHFHDPLKTDEQIKLIMLNEFPMLKSFLDNPNDNTKLLEMMDQVNCKRSWIINYESPRVMGYDLSTLDWVSNFCEDSDKRLIPVGGIHPGLHEDAHQIMRNYFESGLLMGLKVHGPHQLIYPNAYTGGLIAQEKLYQTMEELKIPVIFHTGTSIFPKARSKFGNPLVLEDILIDFPEMTVIMAHGGRPIWMREAEFLMSKFKNLYMDLAGIPPKLIQEYFPRFNRYADRCIFGSDFPSPGVPSSRENVDNVAKFPLPPNIIKKIVLENAETIIKSSGLYL
ncbi:MAG: amidohydrolase family protein [Candidatus Heimdallarchaeota archaeon]|nr:amidohydrolase family protein [Candidatus Heimdallarchaeota archaeon]MDH5644642.1 amidohydrolase family protein [Candidatus Heimdallarchaeota archaeon]